MFVTLQALGGLLSVLFALAQVVIAPDTENMLSVLLCLVGTIVSGAYLLKEDLFQRTPLTALQIAMFTLSTMTFPLIGTTLEGHPVTFGMSHSLQTLSACFLTSVVLIIAHLLYRSSTPLKKWRAWLTRSVLVRLGLFETPGTLQLWIMGAIGCLSFIFLYWVLTETDRIDGSPTVKFVDGLVPFTYAPFLAIFTFLQRQEQKTSRLQVWLLVLYFGVIVGLALLRNSRGTFTIPISIALFGTTLGILSQRLSLKAIHPRTIAIIVIATGIGFPLVSQLAVAMVVAREYRSQVSATEMIRYSVEALGDPDRLRDYKERHQDRGNVTWDEYYVDNPFLSRFINIKFHDNVISLSDNLSPGQYQDLSAFTVARMWSVLPQPALEFLGVGIVKREENNLTFGDYILYINTGKGLGTHRVGSFMGHGLALFGGWFYPLLFMIALLSYPVSDSLIAFRPARDSSEPTVQPIFSPVALLNSFALATFFWGESMPDYSAFFIRTFPQMILLYSLFFALTRWATIRIR